MEAGLGKNLQAVKTVITPQLLKVLGAQKNLFLQLYLDFLGSFAAQLNVLILKYTVDTIIELMVTGEPLSKRFYLLTIINIVLLSKEVLYSIIQFGK